MTVFYKTDVNDEVFYTTFIVILYMAKTILHLFAYNFSADHRMYNGIVERGKGKKSVVIRQYGNLSYLAQVMYDELPVMVPPVMRSVAQKDFKRLGVMDDGQGVVPVTKKEADEFINLVYTPSGKKRKLSTLNELIEKNLNEQRN